MNESPIAAQLISKLEIKLAMAEYLKQRLETAKTVDEVTLIAEIADHIREL